MESVLCDPFRALSVEQHKGHSGLQPLPLISKVSIPEKVKTKENQLTHVHLENSH